MENKGVNRNDLQKLCAVLAKDISTPWVNKLNSQARQSSADRAWAAISRFYTNCREGKLGKKEYPRLKKHSRSVEYKQTGYKLSDERRQITLDCSNYGARVQKSLSTRTHQCPHCKSVLDRDHNAAINILKKGLELLGQYFNGTGGHPGTDPNAWGESDRWTFNGDIESLSRLAEPGIPISDEGRIPRYRKIGFKTPS